MKKSIKFKEQALQLISMLCELEASKNKETTLTNQIYRLSHAAADTNCSHQNWELELTELYKAFKKNDLL